jgi:hypothetical protein
MSISSDTIRNYSHPAVVRRGWSLTPSQLALNGFLVVGWLTAASQFLATEVSPVFARLNVAFLILYPVFLAAAVYLYERVYGAGAKLNKNYVWVFAWFILLLSIYGGLRGNAPRVVFFDLISYGTVLGAYILGRHNAVWRDARATVASLTGLAAILAIMYTDARVLVDRSIISESSGAYFEATLTLAPLFFLAFALDRGKFWYYVLMVISFSCLLVYFYLGRRGISVRCLIEIIFASLVVPKLGRVTRKWVFAGFLTLVFLVGLWLYFPWDTLIQRYRGEAGIVSAMTAENDRWYELQLFWDELSASGIDVVVGRGMGGAFLTDGDSHGFGLDELDAGMSGRLFLHAGVGSVILKGGFLLAIVFFAPIIKVASHVTRWRSLDAITIGVSFAALVLLPFQSLEGTVTYSVPWVGFGIGLIMARVQNRAFLPVRRPYASSARVR